MKFDNSNNTLKIKLKRLTVLLITGACIATVTTIDELDFKLGFSRHFISILLLVIYIIYNIFRILKEYNFISFSNELGKISVRYYQIVTFGKKAKSFEFPLAEFYKYEIQKQGMKNVLIIYQRQDRQIVKYPPVCINSLKKGEIDQITKSLDNIKLY